MKALILQETKTALNGLLPYIISEHGLRIKIGIVADKYKSSQLLAFIV